MPKRPDPYLIDEDNAELTPEQIRAMRPASDVLPELYASLVARYEARQAAARGAEQKKGSGVRREASAVGLVMIDFRYDVSDRRRTTIRPLKVLPAG